jgi:hypothetical protein
MVSDRAEDSRDDLKANDSDPLLSHSDFRRLIIGIRLLDAIGMGLAADAGRAVPASRV